MMVSANPNRPKGPLVKVSWRSPTSMPTSSAESELPSRPWSATTTRKTSVARAKSGQSRTPTKWTSAAKTTVARSLRLCTGSGLFEGLRHGLILQQVDLVEGAEVDGGGDLDAVEELPSRLHGGDRADRDAAREDAVDAGGQHAVARPHVGLQGDIVELQPAPPAGRAHHPRAAGPAVLVEQGAAQLHPLAGIVEPFGDRGHATGHGAQQAQAHGLQPRLAGPRPLDRQVDELAHQHDDQHPAGAALVHSSGPL